MSAVVLAYLEAPWLDMCVDSLLASQGVDAEVIVVDNGTMDGAIARLGSRDGLTVLRPDKNLGFAGGCNFGAARASGEVIAFINSDAIVDPDALARLAEVAVRPKVGVACASLRLADDPDLINSAGNPIHFLGVSWSGGFGRPAAEHSKEQAVTGATGAAMALRREIWDQLGGFEERYFAYHEDAELSVRCWQQGLQVVYVPDAVVLHHYEFSRNPKKFYLVERNRLLFVLTTFETRTLALIAPVFIVYELAVLVLSLFQGWARQKVAGWNWIFRNRSWVKKRRAQVQSVRLVSDRALSDRFAGRLSPDNMPLPGFLYPFVRALELYWSLVRRAL